MTGSKLWRVAAPLCYALCLASVESAPAQSPAATAKAVPQDSQPDYSKDALVIEKLNTDVIFAADGTLVWEQTLAVRVQSDAVLRRFGVLTFPYSQANERIDLVYVRVRKPDGRVVETPEASVQDIPSDVARSAPTYSDLREKQVSATRNSSGRRALLPAAAFQAACSTASDSCRAGKLTHYPSVDPSLSARRLECS